MAVIQGQGEYRYAIANDWAQVSAGMEWREVAAVAIDGNALLLVYWNDAEMLHHGFTQAMAKIRGG